MTAARILLVILTFLPLWAAHAEPVMTNANTLLLTDDDADQMPGRRLALLEDPQGRLTLDDVRSPVWVARFVMSDKTVPRFGFTP